MQLNLSNVCYVFPVLDFWFSAAAFCLSFIKLCVNKNIFPELQQGFILLEVIYTFWLSNFDYL